MDFDWKQITHFRKVQVVSIEFTDEGTRYNWVKLKRSKGEVTVLDSSEKLDKDAISAKVVNNCPILIHAMGKGVLNKVTEPNEDYIENILMNANPDDFYINYLDVEEKRYVSFTRKTALNEALLPLNSVEDNILDMAVGPYHILIDDLRKKTHLTPIGEIECNNGVYSFHLVSSINRAKFENVLLNHSFWAVTIGVAFLKNNLPISVYSRKEKKSKQSNYKDKQQFKYIGIASIVLFLGALIGNYFYQGHINEKNAQLESQIMVFSDNLKKIDQIDQEIARKKQLIANSGIIRNNYFTTTLDEVGKSVPEAIELVELEIYPLKKKLKKKEKPLFLEKSIKVAGAARSSVNIDAWIEKLNQFNWVKNVAILSFTTDEEKNISFFEIKIEER